MWSQAKFLDAFERAVGELAETVRRKNADYAGEAVDPFANFRLIEAIPGLCGSISMEAGILVRITDKLTRLASLLNREPVVADESFLDTCYDLAAYAVILALARRSRTEPDDVALQAQSCPAEAATPAAPESAMEKLRAFLQQRLPGAGQQPLAAQQ